MKEAPREPRLLDQLRNVLRLHHYSIATERVYMQWVRRFIIFHGKRHPASMGKPEVEAFLTYLAAHRKVSPSTQNVALAAILFLYSKVLSIELPWLDDVVRAKPRKRIPVVLSKTEIQALLRAAHANHALLLSLMYGAGLRLMEGIRLRIGDIDFARRTVRIYAGKGGKERITVFPDALEERMKAHIAWVRTVHEIDLADGYGAAVLPPALQRKLGTSSKRLHWQFVFPSKVLSEDPQNPGGLYRHHVHPSSVQRAVTDAAARASIAKRVTCHTLRHSFATHLLESGTDIRTIAGLLSEAVADYVRKRRLRPAAMSHLEDSISENEELGKLLAS